MKVYLMIYLMILCIITINIYIYIWSKLKCLTSQEMRIISILERNLKHKLRLIYETKFLSLISL